MTSIGFNPNVQVVDVDPRSPGYGKLTRDGVLLIQQLVQAVNNSTSGFVTVDGVQTLSNKTLIAPALGTPASAILTNATGLPITGVAAFTSAALAGRVSDETGSGLLVFGSAPAAWTPTDASGAGLTFTSVTARFVQFGKVVIADFRLTYPATADATRAQIGGLPVALENSGTNFSIGSAFANLAAPRGLMTILGQGNTSAFLFVDSVSAGGPLNSNLSGALISGTAIYISA